MPDYKQKNSENNQTDIITVIIIVLSIIILALFGGNQITTNTTIFDNSEHLVRTQVAIELTQTAITQLTETPLLTNTATTIPTQTFTSTAQATHTSTLTPTPIPSATQILSTPESDITSETLNSLLGQNNWFCIPDKPTVLGVKILQGRFTVQEPIRELVVKGEKYRPGEVTGTPGAAAIYLQDMLPVDECPTYQQELIRNWNAQPYPALTQDEINSFFVAGNWSCGTSEWRIQVERIPPAFTVDYPFTDVDSSGQKYGLGDTVPAGSPASVWTTYIDPDECP